MIKADFYFDSIGEFLGFIISGHAGVGRYGQDVLCAGVSSAVMLTVNTITDFLAVKSKVKYSNGKFGFKLIDRSKTASLLIESLYEHLAAIDKDYKRIILTKHRKET